MKAFDWNHQWGVHNLNDWNYASAFYYCMKWFSVLQSVLFLNFVVRIFPIKYPLRCYWTKSQIITEDVLILWNHERVQASFLLPFWKWDCKLWHALSAIWSPSTLGVRSVRLFSQLKEFFWTPTKLGMMIITSVKFGRSLACGLGMMGICEDWCGIWLLPLLLSTLLNPNLNELRSTPLVL